MSARHCSAGPLSVEVDSLLFFLCVEKEFLKMKISSKHIYAIINTTRGMRFSVYTFHTSAFHFYSATHGHGCEKNFFPLLDELHNVAAAFFPSPKHMSMFFFGRSQWVDTVITTIERKYHVGPRKCCLVYMMRIVCMRCRANPFESSSTPTPVEFISIMMIRDQRLRTGFTTLAPRYRFLKQSHDIRVDFGKQLSRRWSWFRLPQHRGRLAFHKSPDTISHTNATTPCAIHNSSNSVSFSTTRSQREHKRKTSAEAIRISMSVD
jgi:hypothetical protein